MASAAEVSEFRSTQSNIVRLAERELIGFYATLDKSDALRTVRALEEFMPLLIQQYGEMGAAVAADWYEELRAENPRIRRAYRAALGAAIPFEQSRVSTKWAVGPLFQAVSDESATLNNLIDVTDRLIKQQGRNTIHENTLRDPAQARYARVPTGAETCSFCLMLASRGAVYLSERSASQIGKYHGRCDCVPTPVWDDNDYDQLKADGYNPDELYDRWQDALESEKDKA